MHWSEVEHDLKYKPKAGALSIAEHELDELNGFVLSGELGSRRLEPAIQARTRKGERFANHYELAAFLLGAMPKAPGGQEPLMGRVDVLLDLLQRVDMDKPDLIRVYADMRSPDPDAGPIARQVEERLLLEHPHWATDSSRANMAPPSPPTPMLPPNRRRRSTWAASSSSCRASNALS